MAKIVVEAQGLVKFYEGRCVLDGIDLKVPQGCIYPAFLTSSADEVVLRGWGAGSGRRRAESRSP